MSQITPPFSAAETDLVTRKALPDPLRALIRQFPRGGWEQNPNYSQLIVFWLDRHLMFRRLSDQLNMDAQRMLDGNDAIEAYMPKLHRFGGMLINELHGHHQIEDAQYFPVMSKLDTSVARGFDILDKDHGQMDGLLDGLAQAANGVLQGGGPRADVTDAVGNFKKALDGFVPMLDRHLLDEEELVVPILLKYAPSEFR